MPISSENNIRVVIYAPSVEAQQIQKRLKEAAQETQHTFKFSAIYQDLADEDAFNHVIASKASLVIVHQEVEDFTVQSILDLASRTGKTPRVVAAWVSPVGDVFDAVENTLAIAYKIPMQAKQFVNLVESIESELAKAAQRMATAAPVPDAPPEPDIIRSAPAELGGMQAYRTQVATTWSSKGGDGKSLVSMELAYVLAMLGGRKTLLVDADMNRGYFWTLIENDPKVQNHAKTKNITTLANLFHMEGEFPSLDDYVYNYPPPFGGESASSKLDIIFGITSAKHPSLPAFAGKNGDNSHSFIVELIKTAVANGYEYVFFDIGTLILAPIHMAVLKESGRVMVVAAPFKGSILPTEENIQAMKELGLVVDDKLALILNMWSDESGISQQEVDEYMQKRHDITTYAKIPAMPIPLMQFANNNSLLAVEAYLADPKQYDAFAPFVAQFVMLAESFAPGTRQRAIETSDAVTKAFGKQTKRGLFGKK